MGRVISFTDLGSLGESRIRYIALVLSKETLQALVEASSTIFGSLATNCRGTCSRRSTMVGSMGLSGESLRPAWSVAVEGKAGEVSWSEPSFRNVPGARADFNALGSNDDGGVHDGERLCWVSRGISGKYGGG